MPALPPLIELNDGAARSALARVQRCRRERTEVAHSPLADRQRLDDPRLLAMLAELENRAVDLIGALEQIGRCRSRDDDVACLDGADSLETLVATAGTTDLDKDIRQAAELAENLRRLRGDMDGSRVRLAARLAQILAVLESVGPWLAQQAADAQLQRSHEEQVPLDALTEQLRESAAGSLP